MIRITFCKRLLTDAKEVIVVQLQFLDLMIRKENEAVPMDAKARADLIDLMARVLVAVFQVEGGKIDDRGPVQSQDHAGAPGSQSHRLPAAVQRETSTAE
jgi:hypothetical protein